MKDNQQKLEAVAAVLGGAVCGQCAFWRRMNDKQGGCFRFPPHIIVIGSFEEKPLLATPQPQQNQQMVRIESMQPVVPAQSPCCGEFVAVPKKELN